MANKIRNIYNSDKELTEKTIQQTTKSLKEKKEQKQYLEELDRNKKNIF